LTPKSCGSFSDEHCNPAGKVRAWDASNIKERKGARAIMPARRLNRPALKQILTAIFSTREREIDCEQCLAELDSFTEQVLAGRELTEAQLLVKEHLAKCGECREEYELLLHALQNMEEE
jgi:hypothetical protein